MLAVRVGPSVRQIIHHHPAISISTKMFSDKISEAYKAVRKQPQTELKEGGGYATKASFVEQVRSQRTRGADAETGHVPTKWQKRFLVITGLYPRQSDIPPYVASGTMDRMHDRMRVVFIVVGVTCFFTLFFLIEDANAKRIARDRDAGVVV